MKVTQVSVRPTLAAQSANRPALTPELLAATGARYSRNNEGLESIISKIDPDNPDASVDSIFRMIDYGHQSIADMAPVAMFIDGVSIWMAYYVWSLSPTAGGQESSTRYIEMNIGGLLSPTDLGIPTDLQQVWTESMRVAFDAYRRSLTSWKAAANENPDLCRIPRSLSDSSLTSDVKKVARMKRNYAFDRARYFLPVAARTNLMLVNSARAWVQLCQHLLSTPLEEAKQLGLHIREELELVTPRLVKHAEQKLSIENGIREEFAKYTELSKSVCLELTDTSISCEADPTPTLEVFPPKNAGEADLVSDLEYHDNRYAWTGPSLKRSAVRFGWGAVAFAEIRDLNRHRTGTKHCPMVANGFYYASDQAALTGNHQLLSDLRMLCNVGRENSLRMRELMCNRDTTAVYWSLLGTQFPFEHLTTADKYIYEAELRTGLGAQYRYAMHLHDSLELWYARYPATRGRILEGSAEPE